MSVLLSFMKTFAISEDYSESRVILFWFPFVLLIDFSCVYPLLDTGENPGNVHCTCHWRLSEFSEAAFGTIVREVSESRNKLFKEGFSEDFQN
jgi:hypothetical protein